eukprot:14205464-Alexandrium_andersonii.AAC.1
MYAEAGGHTPRSATSSLGGAQAVTPARWHRVAPTLRAPLPRRWSSVAAGSPLGLPAGDGPRGRCKVDGPSNSVPTPSSHGLHPRRRHLHDDLRRAKAA